ncbi:MAG TPA: thioesterase family protein [Flavihumibacter sp.]|jgi:acyl-CoA thioester hydrolase
MARIKLEKPAGFVFETIIRIRITDINYGGHMGNDALLSILHEARLQFLQHAGYSEMNVEGVGLIMSDVAIEFRQEAYFGDELLIKMVANDFSRVGFDIFYQVEKTGSEKNAVVAFAKTGMVCFDYNTRKVAPLPAAVPAKLGLPA